ncbi:Bromodomain-containing protein [Chaetomidium leptoderma]|uniref:Bromodomain-containing protein n=1 Tax=Chaetomidium leptoderma TaxID=669021 RepID=A0AAN7A190_9PEZI|nr:Bromodomain-containing protein [Chaetomidium leptoderma]
MDHKRKASASGAGIADGDDRTSKRQKTPGQPSDYNLAHGESRESTTSYGLHFLDTIRRTKDKSGRLVASYFESLIPRETNKEYYERIRMPISLKLIERRLQNQDFKNLSELESYFKRMVTNAKEFYPKNSEIFEDAERVRKALSNYMTKTNPAYKLMSGYSCQATPIPNDMQPESDELSGLGAAEDGAEVEDEDAEGEEDSQSDEEEDAEGDDDEGDEEEDGNPRRIVLKRKGPGRPPRDGSEQARKVDKSGRVKADHEYEGVPYKGLSFQQAQEKIVEELIRKPDGSDVFFLDFINLPPRTYKDYFAVITSPLSLKGLQKLVKGIHGRQPATGVSDFKNWATFEERASLLWTNAHFYNEEGSVIHALATELQKCFVRELNSAKAVVQEPPQQKIKLKMTPGQETPVIASKKITIHVGGSRGSAAASPAPQTGQSSESARPDLAMNVNRTIPLPPANTTSASFQIDNARALPGAVASPRPAIATPMPGVSAQQPPAAFARPNGNVPGQTNVPNGMVAAAQPFQQSPSVHQLQNGHPAPAPPVYDYKYRAPGRGYADSLIPSVLIRTHPSVAMDHRFRLEIPAHPKEAHQNLTLHIPGNHNRLQLIPRLAPFEQQGRQYRVFVAVNGQTVGRATPLPVPDDPLLPDAVVFDANLQYVTNIIAITVIASLPKGQKLPNGADCELEKLVLNIQLLRVY